MSNRSLEAAQGKGFDDESLGGRVMLDIYSGYGVKHAITCITVTTQES